MKKNALAIPRFLIRAFTFGAIATLPIAIVAYVLERIVQVLNEFGNKILKFLLPDQLEKFFYPPSGVVAIVLLVILIGALLLLEENKKIYIFDRIITRLPFGKLFSRRTRETLMNSTQCIFWVTPTQVSLGIFRGNQPVKIELPNGSLINLPTLASVYSGNPPLFFTGGVFFIPRHLVIKIKNPMADLIRMLSALGDPLAEGLILIPWEDETPEECARRFVEMYDVYKKQQKK